MTTYEITDKHGNTYIIERGATPTPAPAPTPASAPAPYEPDRIEKALQSTVGAATSFAGGVNAAVLGIPEILPLAANSLIGVGEWAGKGMGLMNPDTRIPRVPTLGEAIPGYEKFKRSVTAGPGSKTSYDLGTGDGTIPDTGVNRMLRTGGEWMLGPVNKTTAAMAGGAASARELYREYFNDQKTDKPGEWGATAAEVLGGFGALAGAKTGRGMLNALSQGPKVRGFKGADADAIRFIEVNASDPQRALINFTEARARGDVGSLAQMTNDPGIEAATSAIDRATPAGRPVATAERAAYEQMRNRVTGSGVGGTPSPDALKPPFTQAAQRREQRILGADTSMTAKADAQRLEAVNAALAREAALTAEQKAANISAAQAEGVLRGGTAPRHIEGAKLSATHRAAAAENKAENVKPLWDMVKDQPTLPNAGAIVAASDDARRTIGGRPATTAQQKNFTAAYGDIIDDLKIAETPNDVKEVLSKVRARIADEVDRGAVDIAAREWEKTMRKVAEAQIPGYKEATAASRAHFEAFEPGKVPKKPKKPPEVFPSEIGGWSKDSGAETMRSMKASGDPKVISQAEASLRAELATELSRANSTKSINLQQKYAAVLDEVPVVKEQLDAVSRARLNMELAAAETKAGAKQTGLTKKLAQKEYEEAVKQITAKSSGLKTSATKAMREFADDPAKAIKTALGDLGSTKTVNAFTRLYKQSKMLNVEAMFKRNVRSSLDEMLIDLPKAGDTGAAKTVDTAQVAEFQKMKPALIESGILNTGEATTIETALKRGVSNHELALTRSKLSNDTVQAAVDNMIASGLAVSISPMLGSKQSLMVNGTIRRGFSVALKQYRNNPERMASIAKLLSDPATMKSVTEEIARLRSVKDAAEVERKTRRIVEWITQPYAIHSGLVNENLPDDTTED